MVWGSIEYNGGAQRRKIVVSVSEWEISKPKNGWFKRDIFLLGRVKFNKIMIYVSYIASLIRNIRTRPNISRQSRPFRPNRGHWTDWFQNGISIWQPADSKVRSSQMVWGQYTQSKLTKNGSETEPMSRFKSLAVIIDGFQLATHFNIFFGSAGLLQTQYWRIFFNYTDLQDYIRGIKHTMSDI